ncbi:MAG: RNA methyltransferase [Rubrivivax sp.]|nr:RNA methyltransferase [Rubrivivax sp.]MBK8526657.1 RNA methyltransferase [Rubrivivax sp.]
MSNPAPKRILSKANPLLVALRKLARDGSNYRRSGQVWVEGEHLCAAARWRGVEVRQALVSESAWSNPARRELAAHASRIALVPDALFADLSTLESPADIGFVLDLPAAAAVDRGLDALLLDRVQDAGNVGSILRSAAALGVPQVLAIKGCAALWSPKVLRAGMGAHFGLRLIEGLDEGDVLALGMNLVATSSHGGQPLHCAQLPTPITWTLGHEGQGVSPRLLAACVATVCIPQPGGEESLNVAAAAAICLYESLRRASCAS